jgi:DNA-binding MarR family transcriptional regulator
MLRTSGGHSPRSRLMLAKPSETGVVQNGEQGRDPTMAVYNKIKGRRFEATPEEMVLRLRGLTRAVHDFLAAGAKEHGLSPTEFIALIRTTNREGVTGAQLVQAFGMRSSSVTGLADRLEAKGLIARRAHPSDRRAVVLQATGRGRAVVNRAIGPLLDQLLALADGLDTVERAVIAAFLDRIDDALRASERRPSGARVPKQEG